MGLNDDNTNAGYIPATSPTNMAKPNRIRIRSGFRKYIMLRSLSATWLKRGSNTRIRMIAMINAAINAKLMYALCMKKETQR